MSDTKVIEVEVAYALPHKQKIYGLSVEEGVTALEAVKRSHLRDDFENVDIETAKMGIFGQSVRSPETHVLQSGDRVEVYRPLIADPKAARRKRAEKAAAAKQP